MPCSFPESARRAADHTASANAARWELGLAPPDPAFEHIHEPGGFRRNYVLMHSDVQEAPRDMLNNFVDFLFLFGHFVRHLTTV